MVEFYDQAGAPAVYSPDGVHLFRWDGEPVGYFYSGHVYSFSGGVLGWFEDGWLFDRQNRYALFSQNAVGGPMKPMRGLPPLKSLRSMLPMKGLRSLPHMRPMKALAWSPVANLTYFVRRSTQQ